MNCFRREVERNEPVLLGPSRVEDLPVSIVGAEDFVDGLVAAGRDVFDEAVPRRRYRVRRGAAGCSRFVSITAFYNVRARTVPWHTDPCARSGWSLLLCGKKTWMFKRRNDNRRGQGVPETTIVQRQGEIVFIPGGWHHTVASEPGSVAVGGYCADGADACLDRMRGLVRYNHNNRTQWKEARMVLEELGHQFEGLSDFHVQRRVRVMMFGVRRRRKNFAATKRRARAVVK